MTPGASCVYIQHMIANAKKSARAKPAYARAVRINVSIPITLHARVPELLNRFGYGGLSDYYQARMRKDLGLELGA